MNLELNPSEIQRIVAALMLLRDIDASNGHEDEVLQTSALIRRLEEKQ